jgi:mannose/fructose/N-acetylgalactosamine-specific phosphotransferase system component IIC
MIMGNLSFAMILGADHHINWIGKGTCNPCFAYLVLFVSVAIGTVLALHVEWPCTTLHSVGLALHGTVLAMHYMAQC